LFNAKDEAVILIEEERVTKIPWIEEIEDAV
jgi:hypothetical protein